MSELLARLGTFSLGQPWWLLLAPLTWPLWRRPSESAPRPAVVFSSLSLFRGLGRPAPSAARRTGRWLRLLAACCLIVALARPRLEKSSEEENAEGINIMLVLDASRSMESKDFDYDGRKVSRRDALLRVIDRFIKERPRDRIGVVGFAEKPFLVSPLTLDHSWMMESLRDVKLSLGTAIGSGIEAGINLLRKAGDGNRIIIVVTDGLNTSGLDPVESARLARRNGIRLYTIGVVSYADMKVAGIDGITLNRMARMTGGQFFQAADGASLEEIYRQIDTIERQQFRQSRLRAFRDLYAYLVAGALGLLVLDRSLRVGARGRIP